MIQVQGPGASGESGDAGLSFVICLEDIAIWRRFGRFSGYLQVGRDVSTFNSASFLIPDDELNRTASGELESQLSGSVFCADGKVPDRGQVAICREQELISTPGKATDEKAAAGIFEYRLTGTFRPRRRFSLSLIHISEPTRLLSIWIAVFLV